MMRLCLLTLLMGLSYARVVRQVTSNPVYDICATDEVNVDVGDVFNVRSANNGNPNYNNNQRCHLTLQTASNPLLITVTYKRFAIERQRYCNYDALCVNGVKFCGNWATDQSYQYIIPEHSAFTIAFSSDYSVVDRGFDILVEAQAPARQFIDEVTRGEGSAEAYLKTTTLAYFTGYASYYEDRCASEIVPDETGDDVYNYDYSYSSTQSVSSTSYPYYTDHQMPFSTPQYDSSSSYPYNYYHYLSSSAPQYDSSTNYPYNYQAFSIPQYDSSTSYPYNYYNYQAFSTPQYDSSSSYPYNYYNYLSSSTPQYDSSTNYPYNYYNYPSFSTPQNDDSSNYLYTSYDYLAFSTPEYDSFTSYYNPFLPSKTSQHDYFVDTTRSSAGK